MKRIQIDLGLRHPRKRLLPIGGAFLIVREPGFQDLERTEALQHDHAAFKELLTYIDWTDETLEELQEFFYEVASSTLGLILEICRLSFKAENTALEAEAADVAFLSRSEQLRGSPLLAFSRMHYEAHAKYTREFLKRLLEDLGVYVSAVDPEITAKALDDEATVERDRAWIPLTMMANPEIYSKIRSSLVWKGSTTGEIKHLEAMLNRIEASYGKKSKEYAKFLKDLEELKAKDSKAPDSKSDEETPRSPNALIPLGEVFTSQQAYSQFILENANKGFLAAHDKIELGSYSAARAQGIDPLKHSDRAKLLQKQNEKVTVRSRWRGKSSEE